MKNITHLNLLIIGFGILISKLHYFNNLSSYYNFTHLYSLEKALQKASGAIRGPYSKSLEVLGIDHGDDYLVNKFYSLPDEFHKTT